MAKKKTIKPKGHTGVENFIKDINFLLKIPTQKKFEALVVSEYPFDLQLLSLSRLYRESRENYLAMGGTFGPTICSTMRSLSSQNLFANHIDYTPMLSELTWFKDHSSEVIDPQILMNALSCYNEISLFHEQNHRILWPLLPTAPHEQRDFCRYLNLAESLIVTLDLALGDELGNKNSTVLERAKAIYRPGGEDNWFKKPKVEYRRYLLSLFYVTYLELELIEPKDIPKALEYVFPNQKKMNKDVLKRGMELSELFTMNTNRQWQQRFWKKAQERLASIHQNDHEAAFYVVDDPLDFEEEFVIANRVFDHFGI